MDRREREEERNREIAALAEEVDPQNIIEGPRCRMQVEVELPTVQQLLQVYASPPQSHSSKLKLIPLQPYFGLSGKNDNFEIESFRTFLTERAYTSRHADTKVEGPESRRRVSQGIHATASSRDTWKPLSSCHGENLPSLRYRSSSITGRQYETSIAHRGVENCVPSFGDVLGGIFDGIHDCLSSCHGENLVTRTPMTMIKWPFHPHRLPLRMG
jgi:hypothetical protein